jgi:hypothetical protein
MTTFSERLDVALAQGDDAALEQTIRAIVQAELASLGGHLTSEYGLKPIETGIPAERAYTQENPQLATLGGYMLGRYGQGDGQAPA